MLLPAKNGLCCDRCGLTVIDRFTYYSFDAQEVSVHSNTMSLSNPTSSFDICQRCMEELKTIIIKHYKPYRIINNKSCPQGIFCDLTSTRLAGNFTCYYISVSVVVVDVNARPSANVTDDKYLELWVCKDAFDQLKNKAAEIQKNKDNKEWSSKSTLTP